MLFHSLTSLMAVGLATALPQSPIQKRSATPDLVNGKYIVSRQAEFDNQASYTFESGSLPEGLYKSNYGGPGDDRAFVPANAYVQDGYLELLVNGGQTAKPYTCGEVTTTVENILYASVRTVAILTEPAGVCNGMFPKLLPYYAYHSFQNTFPLNEQH